MLEKFLNALSQVLCLGVACGLAHSQQTALNNSKYCPPTWASQDSRHVQWASRDQLIYCSKQSLSTPTFTHGESGAQGSQTICLRSHSRSVGLGSRPGTTCLKSAQNAVFSLLRVFREKPVQSVFTLPFNSEYGIITQVVGNQALFSYFLPVFWASGHFN